MRVQTYPRSLEIKLDRGIYSLEEQSGTGKTYLYHMIVGAREAIDYKVGGLTYDSQLTQGQMLERINREKYDLFMLDRFDSYSTPELCDAVFRMKSGIVLIDVKNWRYLFGHIPRVAWLTLDRDKIEVNGGYSI